MEVVPVAISIVSDNSADMQWFKRPVGGSGINKGAMSAACRELLARVAFITSVVAEVRRSFFWARCSDAIPEMPRAILL